MPRPKRSQGRPGTRVFPENWSESHAPVIAKTRSAVCDIFPPSTAGAVTVNPDLTVTGTGPTALYPDLDCRIQVLNAQDAAAVLGDQEQVTVAYLVATDRDVSVPHKAVIKVKTSEDGSLVGRRLVVRKTDRGSRIWERDLYAVEDQTAPDPT